MASRRPAEARPVAARPPRTLPIGFFNDVISELRKVVWPTREEATRLTIMVLSVAAAVGIALSLIDMGFAQMVEAILTWF